MIHPWKLWCQCIGRVLWQLVCCYYHREVNDISRITRSQSSKYKHRRASPLLCNIRNIRSCMRKKPTLSVTYENEKISIKYNLLYIKRGLHLSCLVHGPIYGRFYHGLYCKWVSLYIRFTKVGDFSEAAWRIHWGNTAVNSLQLIQSPPNSA